MAPYIYAEEVATVSHAKAPELKLLQGNPGKEPTRSPARSATGTPSPPADLKGEAFAEWARVTSYLAKVGRIETIDYAALVVYCSSWAMYDTSRKAFDEKGPLVIGRDGGFVKNPAAQLMKDASDTMLKYGAKFGFTPKDRQNLGIGSSDNDEGDEFERQLRAI